MAGECGAENGDGEGGAGGFAEAEAEIEQGLLTQGGGQGGVAGLGGAMG